MIEKNKSESMEGDKRP